MNKDKTCGFSIVALLLAYSFSQALFAQSTLDGMEFAMADEELLFGDIPSVFCAPKYEQKVTEAPARVSVITADEIRMYILESY